MAADEQNEYQNAMGEDPMMAQGYQQLTVSLTGGMGGHSTTTTTTTALAAPQLAFQQQPQSNRYGNRSNIYRTEQQQQDIG